jgi:hypothetical protein
MGPTRAEVTADGAETRMTTKYPKYPKKDTKTE